MRRLPLRVTVAAVLTLGVFAALPLQPLLSQQRSLGKVDSAHVAPPRRNPRVKLSVNQKFWIPPPPRHAILVLLPGGHGRINLVKGKPTQLTGNFLVKQRRELVRTYFITALMDAPDDLQDSPFLFGNYRRTTAHAQDVGAVIDSLQNKYGQKPIFLLGMSAGATGAANAAYWGAHPSIKGVVLLSSVTQPNPQGVAWIVNSLAPTGENAVPLSGLTVPILFVHHQNDQCGLSPYAAVQTLATALVAAGKDATLATITGGASDPDECDSGLGHHSFQDKAPEVINTIVGWINQKLP